jgi:FAD/FMN-containing dehydrogenase
MSSKLTYTGVTGPAKALTSTVFNDLKQLTFDPEHGTIKVKAGTKTHDLDLKARSTSTITISSGVITATVS